MRVIEKAPASKSKDKVYSAEVLVEIQPALRFDAEGDAPQFPRRTFRVFLERTGVLFGQYRILAIEDLGKFGKPAKNVIEYDEVSPAAVPPKKFRYPDSPDSAVTEAAKREIVAQLQSKHNIKLTWPV